MLNRNFGLNAQALAVKNYLESYPGIEVSWNTERQDYDADVRCATWYNGRERGIVVYMLNARREKQINIAVYEHRNSDQICVLKFETAPTINPPMLADVPEGVFESSSDYTASFDYGRAGSAAEWVYDDLSKFWEDNTEAE